MKHIECNSKISALVVAYKSVKNCPRTFPWLQTVHADANAEQAVGVSQDSLVKAKKGQGNKHVTTTALMNTLHSSFIFRKLGDY
jgi:hypothetical protein